jgi:hypothetical protein
MHPKNIIVPNFQTATEPTISLLVGRFYLGEEIFQTSFNKL